MWCKHKGCHKSLIAYILVVVGGLNLGLVGLGMLIGSNLNVIGLALGQWPAVEATFYLLIGISALAVAFGCFCGKCKSSRHCKDCNVCEAGTMDEGDMQM